MLSYKLQSMTRSLVLWLVGVFFRGSTDALCVANAGEGSFLGIDSSAGQVASARAAIEALGLENIAIECQSLLEVGDDLGTFDYIVCHGMYSWVDAEVR